MSITSTWGSAQESGQARSAVAGIARGDATIEADAIGGEKSRALSARTSAGRPSAPALCRAGRAKTSGGSTTIAVRPAPWVATRVTLMPCRVASRATTCSPSWREVARSTSCGSVNRSLAATRSSGRIPTPQSSTVTTQVPGDIGSGADRIVTRVSGGENRTAFSVSSAIRWVRSATI